MKVFSKKKFFEIASNCEIYCKNDDVRKRVDAADGKAVVGGMWNGWVIPDPWTEDVYTPVEETGKILNTHFPNGFPSVNCRCEVLKEAPPKHPRYKIVIECNDDFTTAQMFVDGHQVKGEAAKRNPEDKFSWRIGAQTAFNRLWEKKKKPVKPVDKYVQLFNEKLTEFATAAAERIFRGFDKLPPAVREVKRDAKPGEWVKVVAANGDPSNEYKNGDVLQILGGGEWSSLNCHGEAYYKEAAGKFLQKDEYVVLEGYKPET